MRTRVWQILASSNGDSLPKVPGRGARAAHQGPRGCRLSSKAHHHTVNLHTPRKACEIFTHVGSARCAVAKPGGGGCLSPVDIVFSVGRLLVWYCACWRTFGSEEAYMANDRNPIRERNPMRRDDEEVGRTNEDDFIGQADDDEDMD